MNNKQNHNKIVAMLLVSVIFLMYLQTVWYPYFYPERYAQKAGDGIQNEQPMGNQSAGRPDGVSHASTQNIHAQNNTLPTQPWQLNDEGIEQAGTVKVETDLLIAEITLLGGRLKHLELKGHKRDVRQSALMDLVNHKSGEPLPLGLYQGAESDELVKYELVWEGQEAKQSDGVYVFGFSDKIKLVLKGRFANGNSVIKTIAFNKGSYVMDVSFDTKSVDGEPTKLEWTRNIASLNDNNASIGRTDVEFVWFDDTKVSRKDLAHFKKEAKSQHQGSATTNYERIPDIKWLSMGELYFNEVMISESGAVTGEMMYDGDLLRIRMVADAGNSASFGIFAGPKQYDVLKSYGNMLEKNINLGKIGFFPSGFATLIATPMMILLNMFFKVSGNYGVAIIILTIFVKLITFPINMSSLKHMKIMSALQPEVKAIQERMKENKDPNALMEFYKKKGVNPMGGCLPAFIQIPFFIGLYSALYCAFELRHAPFALWIRDLSASESLMLGGISVPVLVVLFVAFMLVQQWLTPTMGDPMQKKMMMIMPLFFGFILAKLPAGLTLYMLVSSIISVSQQKVYNRTSSVKDVLVADVACSVALICLGIIFTKLN